jgi:circadian clock protein KaiB
MTLASASPPQSSILRLYVGGNAPNSLRARSNLQTLCAAFTGPVDVEVVDVLETPKRALTDGVLLTPTLVKLAPPPVLKMVGDLSDTYRVRAALGMGGDEHEA